MADRMVTVVGDTVDLYVETNETFEPDVEVQYQRVPVGPRPDPAKPPVNIQFLEKLTAVAVPLRDPAKAKGLLATRVKWKVNLNNDPNLGAETVVLVAIVRGKSKETGRPIAAQVRDLLFVQAIDVTADPKLTRIMLHEFAKPSGANFVFDPKPPGDFVATLSLQQKKLLCRIAERNPAGRLVTFITFYDTARKVLRMSADNGPRAPAMRPNATFSVFHCRDVEKGGVTLVCHTEHFVVHFVNADTRKWILGREGPKRQLANAYMQKNNPEPLEYKLVAHLPANANGHDGVVWCSPFRSNGTSIMPGNFIHGVVNTLGCWMLFRNYNWPRNVATEFERAYRVARRLRRTRAAPVLVELAKVANPQGLRYDVATPPPGRSDSLDKFGRFDRNFAHLWFWHEVVGVKYFSPAVNYLVKTGLPSPTNDRNTHGLIFENTFPLAEVGLPPAFNLPEEGTFAAYDPDNRRTVDRSFRQDDSLWRDNALGFRASAGFVPPFARSVAPAVLRTKSWADLFFYREDDADLSPGSRLVRSSAAFAPDP